MEFCSKCGSFMKVSTQGWICPRCGNVVRSSRRQFGEKPTLVRHGDFSDSIHVVDRSGEGRHRISRVCPKCGNNKVYHWVSRVSGEHAGIRRERTIEHFKCTRCSHTWGRNA